MKEAGVDKREGMGIGEAHTTDRSPGIVEKQTHGQNLDLALIGNSCAAAFVDRNARIVWWCFPHFDSDPVFSRLIAGDEEKGFCDILLAGHVETHARYVRNTAIVETILTDERGAKVRVTDFAPCFSRFEREYRPPQILRRIEPIVGLPRVTIRVRPTHSYGKVTNNFVIGSNHIRYIGASDVLRLTSDAPLSYVANEVAFPLTRPVTLIFGQDDPFLGAIEATSREFLDRTRDYWLEWSRNLATPFEWQSAVIRSAITLKLTSFTETGAIVAAHTTSIPEAPGSSRNWDYRFCWLRDAYFVVDALNRLGATQIMENYINYITTIATDIDTLQQPLHTIVPNMPLDERIAPDLKGFLGYGPVRVGNQAAEQIQNDVFGSVVLAATQMFVDERLPRMGDEHLFQLLERLGERAAEVAFRPDAGLWEYRGIARAHTYSATLCWAACDRLSGIARKLGIADRAKHWRSVAQPIRERILAEAWDEKQGALTGAFGAPELDASVLLVSELGLLPPKDPRFVKTCEAIGRGLMRKGRIMRYVAPDDFGEPETAFLACNFWYMDALHHIGRTAEAREMFESILASRNAFGILSEDIHPETGELWGNLPQTYSMAGIINTATRLSSSWENAWARG
jgi:GH15 family glucan-1,4-alpha-glucosidase